jgi:hypothetical protein
MPVCVGPGLPPVAVVVVVVVVVLIVDFVVVVRVVVTAGPSTQYDQPTLRLHSPDKEGFLLVG